MATRTLVEKTQLQIRDMILNKEYGANKYLPSEGDLCERFGVSRVTVREAVRSLEVRGFVRRVHGKGIKVINNSAQVMTQFITDMLSMNYSDMVELIEVRGIIEIAAARMAAERADDEDIERLRANLAVMESTEVMDDRYYVNDFEFHVNLVKAAKNQLLQTIVTAYTPLLKDVVVTSSQVDYCIERRFHFHRRVFDSIGDRDGDAAEAMMRIHLKANRENFYQHLETSGAHDA